MASPFLFVSSAGHVGAISRVLDSSIRNLVLSTLKPSLLMSSLASAVERAFASSEKGDEVDMVVASCVLELEKQIIVV